MKRIKVTDDIWAALQGEAVPFVDTENDVLTRWWRELSAFRTLQGSHAGEKEASSMKKGVLGFQRAMGGIGAEGDLQNETGKRAGKKNRLQYVEDLRAKEGIDLRKERRTAFLTKKGDRVIILVANGPAAGQWFLGEKKEFVAEKPNSFLILLCVDRERRFDFVIPPSGVTALVREVREVQGQAGGLRFSVFRSDERFKLRRLGGGSIELDKYLSNYDELRRAVA